MAEDTPDRIFKEAIDIELGLTDEQAQRCAKALGFEGANLSEAAKQMQRLYGMFTAVDATQVEINPLGETDDGRVVCFDAKVNFDDNAEVSCNITHTYTHTHTQFVLMTVGVVPTKGDFQHARYSRGRRTRGRGSGCKKLWICFVCMYVCVELTGLR